MTCYFGPFLDLFENWQEPDKEVELNVQYYDLKYGHDGGAPESYSSTLTWNFTSRSRNVESDSEGDASASDDSTDMPELEDIPHDTSNNVPATKLSEEDSQKKADAKKAPIQCVRLKRGPISHRSKTNTYYFANMRISFTEGYYVLPTSPLFSLRAVVYEGNLYIYNADFDDEASAMLVERYCFLSDYVEQELAML
jgi:hypothetical protein